MCGCQRAAFLLVEVEDGDFGDEGPLATMSVKPYSLLNTRMHAPRQTGEGVWTASQELTAREGGQAQMGWSPVPAPLHLWNVPTLERPPLGSCALWKVIPLSLPGSPVKQWKVP